MSRAGPLLSLRGVTVRYGGREALRGIDLEVAPGERVALIGPSGGGKTTLISVVNGAVEPAHGSVTILGADPGTLPAHRLRALRARVGTVHQNLELVGALRVVHNVNAGSLGRWSPARALLSLVAPRDLGRARDALARFGIEDKLLHRTDRLSGGEQQRVALARVVVQDPDIILADEPVSSLDPARSEEVMDALTGLAGAGKALIVSLHEYEYGLRHCGRVIGLRDGVITFDAAPADVGPAAISDLYRISGGARARGR